MDTGPLTVTVDGDTFDFDAGALCLQVLVAPDDLTAWAAAVLGVSEVTPMTPEEGADAATLRDAVGRTAAALAAGRPAAIGDIARINRIAVTPDLAPQLGAGRTRDWAWPASVGQVLSTIARDAIDLLTSPARDRVRRCAAADCDLVFVDTSRPGSRRWCAMTRCGNRSKVRAYRARTAADAAT